MTYNVYADVILLNNFTMDFLLLTTVQRMMKLKARRGGIVLASLAGAFYALAVILIPLPVFFVQTFFTCAGMSTLMTLLAFRLNSPAAVLRAIAGLYLAAVLAAGIMEFFRPFGWFSAFWLYAAAALACAWLLYRRVISWPIPVAYIGAVAVLTLVFYKGDSALSWMLYSVMGGGVMLGAIFMATDYATSPALPAAQIVYGLGCGVLTVIIRYFGIFPEGVTYAILIMNACAWALDRAMPMRRFGVAKGGAGK